MATVMADVEVGALILFVEVGQVFWNRNSGGVYVWFAGFGYCYCRPGGIYYNRGGGHVQVLSDWGTP